MTCRERLQKEHPDEVRAECWGGCNGCPSYYGYVTGHTCLAEERKARPNHNDCRQCWDMNAIESNRPESRVEPARRATVYISGPITGVEKYWEAFERAEEALMNKGWVVLTPSRHPQGLTNAQYMKMDLAMIDSADVVFFLPGWNKSKGARLERFYCEYIQKPYADDLDSFGEVSK